MLLLFAAGPVFAQNQPRFQGVGDLAGGAADSVAEAVSHDGLVVVGGSESAAGPQAFRWTASGGIQGLGDLAGGVFSSHASGVSSNGSVIVGTGVNSSDESRAFRWTSGGGLVALNAFGCFGCPAHAFGNGISANGLVVVGSGAQQIFIEGVSVDAARWTGGGTSISNMGHLSGGGDASEALAASSTGSVIVGASDSSAGVQAFRWSSSGGMVALGNIAGALVAAGANDVSDDGAVIVGFVNTSAANHSQREAVRWLSPGYAPQLLGGLPGAPSPGSNALAVSPDGALVVGSANDEQGDDAAFLWDAAHGMRKLSTVLTEEYGLSLGGWRLVEARGISAVNPAGEVTIVGTGENPAGDREGWVALLSPTACNDGIDNDGDGWTDFPADPHCTAKGDRSETVDCGDGLDNDGDGQTDYPADPQCTSTTDATELADCGDAFDNDGDGLTDHPADPGCRTPATLFENPDCQNGLDDDFDGQADFPLDAGCNAADDRSEGGDCGDGIDNDGDGQRDFPADTDCQSLVDTAEDPQCSDRVDNDGDGREDYPEDYPACASPIDTLERKACSDGADNDGDGLVDYPGDPGCLVPGYGSEAPKTLALGDVLVLDRRGDALFRLDLASGVQTLLSSGAQLSDPQGLAVRSSGAVLVADPNGLLEIVPSTGSQRRLSPPLDSSLSLQAVFDAAGDAVVLEAGGLTRIPFVFGGVAPKVPLLTLPGTIVFFQGDALAREASGSLLVGGFGVLGDGIYRVAAGGSPVTKVTPGFSSDVWQDFAVEANGTILAAGARFGVGPGIFRVDPVSGVVTALATGADWTAPSAVAVGLGGRIFAADAGTCTTSGCSGAEVVELNPSTGARIHVRTGGLITGETDLAVVTALPACGNGVDDDGDGKLDFPADVQCDDLHDASELPNCSNGLDDDGDGLTDFPADQGCEYAIHWMENPACDDGVDNDGDGTVDFDGGGTGLPADSYCSSLHGAQEGPSTCGLGAELVVALPLLAAWRRRRLSARAS